MSSQQQYQLSPSEQKMLQTFYAFSYNPRNLSQLTRIPESAIRGYYDSLDQTRQHVEQQQQKQKQLTETQQALNEMQKVKAELEQKLSDLQKLIPAA